MRRVISLEKFDGSVYKVCRDFLDSMGWYRPQDNTYRLAA